MTLKMKFKKIALGAGVFGAFGAFAASIVACGGTGTATGQPIAFLVSTLNNPFFSTIQAQLRERIRQRGLDPSTTLRTFDSSNSLATETRNVQDIINLGFKVVIMNDVNFNSGVEATRRFNEAGIQVIHIDHPVDPGISRVENKTDIRVVANIASDNVQAGQVLAKFYHQTIGLPFNSKTFAAYGLPGTESSIQRAAGFNRPISADGTSAPNDSDKFRIYVFNEATAGRDQGSLGVQGDDNREKTQTQTTANFNFITNNNIRLAFATNDEGGLGIIRALKGSGRTLAGGNNFANAPDNSTWVVSVDHSDDALTSVLNGELTATVFQNTGTTGMSGMSIDIALSILGLGDPDEASKADGITASNAKLFNTTLDSVSGATDLQNYFSTPQAALGDHTSPNTFNYWLRRYPNVTNDIITRQIVGGKVQDTDKRTPILGSAYDSTNPSTANDAPIVALNNGPFFRINTVVFWRGQTPLTEAESSGNGGKYIGQYVVDNGLGLKVITAKEDLPDNSILEKNFGANWKDIYVKHWENSSNLQFPSK